MLVLIAIFSILARFSVLEYELFKILKKAINNIQFTFLTKITHEILNELKNIFRQVSTLNSRDIELCVIMSIALITAKNQITLVKKKETFEKELKMKVYIKMFTHRFHKRYEMFVSF